MVTKELTFLNLVDLLKENKLVSSSEIIVNIEFILTDEVV
jgi:hypothetical protein